MRTTVLAVCVAVLGGLTYPVAAGGEDAGEAEGGERLARLYAVSDSTAHSGDRRTTAIIDAYESLFAAERQRTRWEEVGDGALLEYFDATQEAGFHSGAQEHARELASTLALLERRGLETSEHVEAMHRLYLHARLFDEARRLAALHPSVELEAVPEVIGSRRNSAGVVTWQPGADAASLIEQPFRLRGADRIVVVAHPGCAYSRAAAEAIVGDPVLGPVFAAHASWIAPPSGRLELHRFSEWNATHPASPISLAVRRADWPMIDDWATPTFHLFRGGERVGVVSGWPLDGVGRRGELLEALSEAGLID